jgi:DUF1680 family protein
LVLCLESADVPDGVSLDDVLIDPREMPSDFEDGARVSVVVIERGPNGQTGHLPYGATDPSEAFGGSAVSGTPRELTLVPYHRWAERGASSMRVFLPVLS